MIYYAHGIRDVLEPVSLRDQDGSQALRDQLGALGYAIAYSSFSENGYAIEDAVRRTHQLRGLFVSRFGKPEHSYLFGHSLGALAIMQLAEKYPNQYDGVVAACGILSGTRAQLEYIVHVRALFDYFYPGLLPGSAAEPVPGYVIDTAKRTQIITAVLTPGNQVWVQIMARTTQTPLEFTTAAELVESLITALSYHARGADNVLTFTHGKFPVSNRDVIYTPRLPSGEMFEILAIVNAQIPRFDADRAGEVWMDRNFTPSGELELPTITLHNRWDPLVPFFHEGLFAARVELAGAGDLLIQRADPAWGYGHCKIPVAEQVRAITDLAAWVTTGVKPAN